MTQNIVEELTTQRRVVVKQRSLDGAARLITFGPDDPRWARIAAGETVELADVLGSFVRVEPPESASPEHVEQAERALRLLGAAAVKVLPRRVGVVAPAEIFARRVASYREIVLGVVDEARTEDRDALREVVTATMDEEGAA